MEKTSTELDTLLATLKRRIESRGAVDYLTDLVDSFDGHFGSWLVSNQIVADHDRECPDCADDLDAGIIGDD